MQTSPSPGEIRARRNLEYRSFTRWLSRPARDFWALAPLAPAAWRLLCIDRFGWASYNRTSVAMAISALIIDDEQLARDELKYLLDSVGGVDVVAQGANGIEAVDLIEEHRPDLVFLDVQMPGQDGFAVIQRLMERNRREADKDRSGEAAALPQFVFATAYDQYAVRAFDVNAVDYLLKPFDRARVLRRWSGCARGMATGGSPAAVDRESSRRLDRLLRLLNRPKAPSSSRTPAKLIVQAQSRLLLVDQAEICYAAIDEGVIRVVTRDVRGAVEVPDAGRTDGIAPPGALLAGASRVCREHRPDSRSDAVVQVQLPTAHERQTADRDSGKPRTNQAAAGAVQFVER